ncbi:MAG TPA: LuxR C-terminal-related transcriptional regulator [Marmoricola sp.]|nr:LuxR C-terminal-related transcriptional regulator [Marmoricola sp.]
MASDLVTGMDAHADPSGVPLVPGKLSVPDLGEPSLGQPRLRLSGHLVEVDAADLSLTVGETRILLRSHGIALAPAQVELLHERTQGWAAAGTGTNQEIAEHLFISAHPLRSHMKSINRKLGAANRRDAVRRAVGWASSDPADGPGRSAVAAAAAWSSPRCCPADRLPA